MTAEARRGLLAVATSIADGEDINWPQVEKLLDSGSDHDRALLRSLRVIASIGELHRSTDDDPEAELLVRRGRVVGRIGPAGETQPESETADATAAIIPPAGSDLDDAAASGAPASAAASADAASASRDASLPPATTVRTGTIAAGASGFGTAPLGSKGGLRSTGPADTAALPPTTRRHGPTGTSPGISSSSASRVPSSMEETSPAPDERYADAVATRATPEPGAAVAGETAVPERWGSLTVRERVGSGVFGEVYRAYDEQLQREVALKLLRTGTRSADRLAAKVLHEGRLLARVRHPNVVLVHGVEARGDRVGLWMEFIRGCTLEELLARQGLFGAREAALVGQDLCRALAAVHAAGLVHRDVKAQNVMREEGGRVVLMDFGTGVPIRDDDSGSGAPAAGTPLYLAPELLEGGEATIASDLYSLGVLLYHLVTGSYPLTAVSLADLREAHRRGRRRLHDVRPDLPDAFVQAVDRALAPNPAERHASAGAMQEALTRALGVETAPAPPASMAPAMAVPQPLVGDPQRSTAAGATTVASAPHAAMRSGVWRRWVLGAGLLAILAAAALAASQLWRRPGPAPINSIVVLPLANVSSADRDLGEGINLLIVEQLSTLPSLRMVQYTASMASRDKGEPVSEIIRRAQTDAAISGSVDWSGARAHVYLQLVRAGASTPVWVKNFDVPVRRAAELPRSVARDVAAALSVTLSPTDELVLAGHEAGEPDAFEQYLRARVNMRIATVPAVKQAIQQLHDALRRDPTHAPSLAALADCYIVQAVSQRVLPTSEAATLAREAAERALQLDSQLPEGYQALAEVKFYMDWDWAGADAAYKRAIEFRPNSGDLRSRYAMFLASRKRLPDAMQAVHEAVALDPMSATANAALGMLWHYARSDDQAERIYRGVLEQDPMFYPARVGLIRTYLRTRRFDLVVREIERLKADSNNQLAPGSLSMLALAYAGLGRTQEAAAIAEELIKQDGSQPSIDAAGVFVALNQRDRALAILDEAITLKSPKALFLRLDTRFDSLLTDPKFRGLLRRMGFDS